MRSDDRRFAFALVCSAGAAVPETVSAATRSGRRGRRAKKSSEQRALDLLKDPRLSAVEPAQVLCRMCGAWIKLFKHTDYAAANWRTHAERCEIRTKYGCFHYLLYYCLNVTPNSWSRRIKNEPQALFALPNVTSQAVSSPPASENASSSPPADNTPETQETTVEPSISAPAVLDAEVTEIDAPAADESVSRRSGKGKSLEQRKAMLHGDPDAAQCEPHRVLCGFCSQWVRLHNTRPYDLYNWTRHVSKCRTKSKKAPKALGPVTTTTTTTASVTVSSQETVADTTLVADE